MLTYHQHEKKYDMKVSQNTIIHDPKGQETGGGHFSNLALLVHPI
jgi:hypothetical protein